MDDDGYMISGTNGIAGCAYGLLVFIRNANQAKLNISGRGAPSLELNLSREKAKWKLLDDVPKYKPDLFPSVVHDFMCEKKNVRTCPHRLKTYATEYEDEK